MGTPSFQTLLPLPLLKSTQQVPTLHSHLSPTTKRVARAIDFQTKFKTEVCRKWEYGTCEYKGHCAFAHGSHELRVKTHTPLNYKSMQYPNFLPEDHPTAPGSKMSSANSLDEAISTTRIRLPVFIDLESRCK